MSQNSTISIGIKLEDGANGFKQLVLDAKSFKEVMRSAVVEAEKLKKPLVNFAALATGIDSVSRTVSDLQKVLKGLTGAHAAQIEAENQLAVNMRNTMSATEADIQAIKDFAQHNKKSVSLAM